VISSANSIHCRCNGIGWDSLYQLIMGCIVSLESERLARNFDELIKVGKFNTIRGRDDPAFIFFNFFVFFV
jgi:hypothetical protein